MAPTDPTPEPARTRQLLSRPRLIGVGVAVVVMIAIGMAWPVAVLAGLGGYAFSVAVPSFSRPRPQATPADPFSVGEPWRHFVQGAQRSARRLHETVDAAADGPLRDRMRTIADRLDGTLADTWAIARRGDRLDSTIRELDPTALRSRRDALERRRSELAARPGDPADDDLDAAIRSVGDQIEATERMRAESERTADRLRLTQARLDELVARAAEIGLGTSDPDRFSHDVDDLAIELESLRLAVEDAERP